MRSERGIDNPTHLLSISQHPIMQIMIDGDGYRYLLSPHGDRDFNQVYEII